MAQENTNITQLKKLTDEQLIQKALSILLVARPSLCETEKGFSVENFEKITSTHLKDDIRIGFKTIFTFNETDSTLIIYSISVDLISKTIITNSIPNSIDLNDSTVRFYQQNDNTKNAIKQLVLALHSMNEKETKQGVYDSLLNAEWQLKIEKSLLIADSDSWTTRGHLKIALPDIKIVEENHKHYLRTGAKNDSERVLRLNPPKIEF